MKRLQASMLALAIVVALTAVGLLSPRLIHSGDLDTTKSPAPTMKTLNEIPPTWSQKLASDERFELVMGDDAVLDKETGLVWEQSPNTSTLTWKQACAACYEVEVDGRKGWRLPTIEELASLVDSTQTKSLPSGHPFSSNVQADEYWSITTRQDNPQQAYTVDFSSGLVVGESKSSSTTHRWCVRGNAGHDGYY